MSNLYIYHHRTCICLSRVCQCLRYWFLDKLPWLQSDSIHSRSESAAIIYITVACSSVFICWSTSQLSPLTITLWSCMTVNKKWLTVWLLIVFWVLHLYVQLGQTYKRPVKNIKVVYTKIGWYQFLPCQILTWSVLVICVFVLLITALTFFSSH